MTATPPATTLRSPSTGKAPGIFEDEGFEHFRVNRRSVSWFGGMWILVRRELRDTFRDWRMITPIVLLTLFFPVLMTWTAGVAQNFVNRFGTPLIGERLIPFLLLIVGFFPMSFSLVIALEAFVGERERKSLEPLLSTPLTDGQLYLGKMIASLVPALLSGAHIPELHVLLEGRIALSGGPDSFKLYARDVDAEEERRAARGLPRAEAQPAAARRDDQAHEARCQEDRRHRAAPPGHLLPLLAHGP